MSDTYTDFVIVPNYFGGGGGGAEGQEQGECCAQEISETHLKDVKQVLFKKGKAYSPVEKCEVFQEVMSLLSRYELADVESRSSRKHKPAYLYVRLKTKIKMFKTMEKDFIFYFVLALRFQRPYFVDIYQVGDAKEELNTFIKYVAKRFRKLEPERIAHVFRSFLERGTFNTKTTMPQPGAKCYDFDVFSSFLQSCQYFVEIIDDIRCIIVILSMYMATVHALDNPMPEPSNVWKNHLIKKIREHTLDEKMIEDIRKGREQANLFEVPENLTLNEQLMVTIFLGDDCMKLRKFRLLRFFLRALQPTCDDLIVFIKDVLVPIRLCYKSELQFHFDSDTRAKALILISGDASTPQISTVKEGLEVVEQVVILQKEKQQKSIMNTLHDEIQKWLQLLISVIDLRGKEASDCCKLLLSKELFCCIYHEEFIKQELITTVEKSFRCLHVDTFIPLFQGLNIWQKEHIAAYLADYDIETYGLELGLCGWHILLKEIVERFPETEAHDFILGFLKTVADWYAQQHRPRDFFRDLLVLDVPKLFHDYKNAVMDSFHAFLASYYDTYKKHCMFTYLMDSIMKCGSAHGRNCFQDTVLQIVSKGIVKEILDYKDPEKCLDRITRRIDMSNKHDESTVEIFCWNVVGELSGRLPQPCESQPFPKQYRDIYMSMGCLYKQHCKKLNPRGRLMSVGDCVNVPQNASPQRETYFKWVQCMHNFIVGWRNRLAKENVTYEDIVLHRAQYRDIHVVMTELGFENLVINEKDLETLISNFTDKRKRVSSILIKTHIEKGKTLWCNLPSALSPYGLSLPDDVIRDIDHHVIYPAEKEGIHDRESDHKAEPSSLKLQQVTTLHDLSKLCEQLDNFFKGFERDTLKVFVFFHLHQSSLFRKYLKHDIKCQLHAIPGSHHCVVTVKVFSEAIQKTKTLLCRLIQGEAEYREIVADGAVDLKDIETDLEISVLEKSVCVLDFRVKELTGLLGVKSMIELFKAATHIRTLENIFNTYNLKLCAKDKDFEELCKIAYCSKEQLTPNLAIEYLKTVKAKLSIPEEKSVDCLEFLHAVFRSKTFYEFLSDRRFYGKQGHKAFRQQYELITAQLQNKASQVEETILNHLLPAFKFLSPFIFDNNDESTQPCFKDLVSEMWTLDITNGPKQLKTVYENVYLVFQWFSEVQGDTAKNIESELEDIMKTGVFCLKADAPFQLKFQRSAGVAMSVASPSPYCYVWHANEIREFVTRLGFLSSKGEMSRMFVCINEVAHKSFDLISKIKHFEADVSIEISCAKSPQEAKSQLQSLQTKHTKGREIVMEVRREFRWLYYIPGSTVSELYKALLKKDENLTVDIVLMFSPLNCNTDKCRKDCAAITTNIQKKLVLCPKSYEEEMVQEETFSPVTTRVVGQFLDEVLPIELPEMFLKGPQQHHVLHYTPGYGGDHLIKFLLEIYKEQFPKRCQVFWCNEATTEDELEYFFDRIEGVSSLYTLLETNNLPIMLQEYTLQRSTHLKKKEANSVIHYVDTKPSLLHETFDVQEHNVSGPAVTNQMVLEVLRKQKCSSIELVCGIPGDGKSYYILRKLKTICSSDYVRIPINEGFSRHHVIKSLCSLPLNRNMSETKVFGIFFNFTMHFTEETLSAPENQKLLKKIGWFLFELLVLGMVDDFQSASCFQLHSRAIWHFFIEVPPLSSTSMSTGKELEENTLTFCEQFPIFHYIGTRVMISFINQLSVDTEVQLVCKYLKTREGSHGRKGRSIKPLKAQNLPAEECIQLLNDHTPRNVSRKISQKLFIRYMYRRCQHLEALQGKGETTSDVCSTLLEFLLKEATTFVNPEKKEAWCRFIPYQLIYSTQKDGRMNITLLTSNPALITFKQKQVLKNIGINVPTENELRSRDYLVDCLSRALKIPVTSCDEILTDEHYVVTLDFVLKMLNINERRLCGVPVVIEGETGVGKTALIEILSKLWNISYIEEARQSFQMFITEKLKEHHSVSPDKYQEALDRIERGFLQEHIAFIAHLPLKTGQFCTIIKKYILNRRSQSFWYFLKLEKPNVTISDLIRDLERSDTPEMPIMVADILLNCCLLDLFFKIPIHSAITPEELSCSLTPIIKASEYYIQMCPNVSESPIFVVFLDELNTSSCGGVLKEIIVDRTLFGQVISSNVFIVGAGNPHRGDATKLLESVPELWCRTTYHVQPLHPTLRYLVWDYGALGPDQEEEYVKAKLQMVYPEYFKSKGAALCESLSDLILKSQNMMRKNVNEFLTQRSVRKIDSKVVKISSHSCVSQRDIQRVITFYHWILKLYMKFSPHGTYSEMEEVYQRRAVLVSLGIVYYLRQPDKYRKMYEDEMGKGAISQDINFAKAFNETLDWVIKHITIPSGIAQTKALKENLFATISCICTRTPVLIVGEPGSSKSLSFHLVVESLRGKESTSDIFKETDIFPSVDPYFLQCSRYTTSNDIVTVFERAKGRQETFANPCTRNCVVFMDEAGLPEESRESLKALHYYLDNPSVAFVGISNHVLDAAKTNRCACVVRMKMSGEELKFLAKGCICDIPNHIPPERSVEVERIMRFCHGYEKVIKKQHKTFFGLRDFVHFLHYFRRYHDRYPFGKLVLRGLERNFNGIIPSADFFVNILNEVVTDEGNAESVCEENSRGIIDILQESLSDSLSGDDPENAVRYKLIIDPSKDNSLVRYLFKYNIMEKKNTRMFMCSDAFSDEEAQKVVIVSTICHSVTEGHTVILCQTSEINESFYDLFNLRYRCIDDPEQGRLYYANVAVGPYIKPCRVDRKFQCIVLLPKEEVSMMPAPFLNRFEKYHITYGNMLHSAMRKLPYGWRALIKTVNEKVEAFAEEITASASLFGYHEEMIPSLFLWFLPATLNIKVEAMVDHSGNSEQFLLEIVVHFLKGVGFYIPSMTRDEMELDVKSLLGLLRSNADFGNYVQTLTDSSAYDARAEALRILNDTEHHESPTISVGACFIISLTLQWMVRHLCKALMQVMTPEAVVIFDQKIPSTYITHYLKHQEHFDLKTLISKRYQMMLNESLSGIAPTKLLVFCRTSLLITNLTFNCASGVDDSDTRVTFIDKQNHHTEAWFSEKVNEFYGLRMDQCILVIKVNMQETSVKAINHIRMMIEDTENHYSNQDKLAVVLLHYPLSMFSGSSYPALFQFGWSHHYLDSVSVTQVTPYINTKQWISLTLESEIEKAPQIAAAQRFTEKSLHKSREESPIISERGRQSLSIRSTKGVFTEIVKGVQHLIAQKVPTLVSLLASKITINTSTSHQTELASKEHFISVLLNEKGFGTLLCQKFEGYLSPARFAFFLRKAASSIFKRESSARMSVIIQSLICTNFSEFMQYMVSVLNESGSLHVVLDSDCPPEVLTHLKEVVRSLYLPKFSMLTHLNIIRRRAKFLRQMQWLFPFYSMISNAIDDIIVECKCEVRERSLSIGEDSFCLLAERDLTLRVEAKFLEIWQRKCISHNGKVLYATIKLMEENEGLLDRYLCDFMSDKLTVVCIQGGVVFDVLKKYLISGRDHLLSPQSSFLPFPVKYLISSHVHLHYHRNVMTQILPIVKQLNELQPLAKEIDGPLPCVPTLGDSCNDDSSLINDIENLCSYVVDLLFYCIQSLWSNDTQSLRWYPFYHKMINNQHVKKLLYKNMDISIAAKLNIMHTVYSILSCANNDDVLIQCAQTTFCTLCNKYIWGQKLEDLRSYPQLEQCVSLTFDVLSCDIQQFKVSSIFHRLLEHFFSEQRSSYDQEDVKWLIQLLNGSAAQKPIRIFTDSIEEGIPFGVVKHYLTRVLIHDKNPEGRDITFLDFSEEYRYAIGEELQKGADDKHYSPFFYVDELPTYPPLTHLYFSIVLETHMENPYISQTNIRDEVVKLKKQRSESNMKLLLSIEQQALIQTLLKKIAENQAEERMGQTLPTQLLLSDVSSCDMMRHHGTVIAMHLLNYCRNCSKLKRHIENLNHNGMTCLQNIANDVPSHAYQHSWLLSLDVYKPLVPLYETVCREMMCFYESGDDYDVGKLLNLHKSWSKSRFKEVNMGSKNCLVMMMWLAAYHNFFIKNIYFKRFISVLKEWKSIAKNQLKLFEIILVKDVQCTSNNFFEELFHTELQDETKIEMRTCIVNIIAVIFGTRKGSNHLWYHLIEPEELDGTFLSGFMYPHVVSSKDYFFYEDGTHLTSNGMYGKYEYIMADGNERYLTLPSLYVLLWINFATFGMADFIEVSQDRKIKYVCEDPHNSLATCSERLQSIWRHMTTNLDFCDEHVSHLITHCLSGVLRASGDGSIQGGVLTEHQALKAYERIWQTQVFDCAYAHVYKKVSEEISSIPALKVMDDMKRRFPKSLSLDDLSYMVQTKALHQKDLKLLSQFIIEYHRLYLGSCLLPDLVRLYQWLHQELAHSVTMETASKITLDSIEEQLARDTSDSSDEFFELYRRILDKFSKYVSLTGRHKGVPVNKRQSHITENTVLKDLVSGVPNGRDCIYRVMNDIISSHGSVLECASTHRCTQLPSIELHPSLVSPNDCIIDAESTASKMIMLLRKWTCFRFAFPDKCFPEEGRQYLEFNFNELQEDLAEFYLAGKPMIQNAETMYTWFSFVQPAKTFKSQELVQIKQQLPVLFHESLQKYETVVLEKEFHSATFQDYESLINIFSISVHVLVSEVKQASDIDELAEKCLDIFLCSEEGEEKTFRDLRLSESQLAYVKGVKLKHLFSILEIFLKWNDDGVYDFHMLPYGVKGHISGEDEEKILIAIQPKYAGNTETFSKDLINLEGALVDVQSMVLKTSHEVPIRSLLDREQTPLADCIPTTICIYQYVSLRLTIRRLIKSCQNALPEIQDNINWQEYEPEPWQLSLHCVMQTTAVDSQCHPSQERFGLGIKPEAEDNLNERFQYMSEGASTDIPRPHKEYMSESMTVEDHSPQLADLVMSITPGKKAIDFDTDEVCKFLRVTGLSECIEWAENEGITGKDLMDSKTLSQEELRSLKDSFYRLKLLVNLQCLQNECQRTKMAQQYPPKKIAQFLGYIGEKYERYIQLFLDNEVDGEILDQANDEALKDLGIPSAIDRAIIKHKFSKLREEPSLALPAETVHGVLMESGLDKVATFVEMHGIDSEVFAKASDDLKTEMKIKPADHRKIKRKLSSMEQDSNT